MFNNCDSNTPSPCPSMRPVNYADWFHYDLFYCFLCEILILTFLICITLCNIACIFIANIRYITFDTCLDYLCPSSVKVKHDWDILLYLSLTIAYIYLLNGPLLLSLSTNLHSFASKLVVELLILTFKTYLQSYYNFIYFCEIMFADLNPCTKLIFLFFFEMILLLSSDIETQPGPRPRLLSDPAHGFSNSFFSFCNWNINTLSKNYFQRVSFLEAHNSLFKYDIISLCETSLNEAIKVPDNIIKGYHFLSSNHPSGDKRGGVGIFYKESLPLKVRYDLSFDECIVTELVFGRKKIFFTVLYRNPITKVGTPEFEKFVHDFEELNLKIKNENPYTILYAGDFNAHSLNWWSQGDSTNEGIQLDNLFSDLNLTQIISEPTHFRENCLPSCIDLILSDQPNLVLNSGVRPSLDPTCKHQITFCKINFSIPPPPAYSRKVWQFNKANSSLITRASCQFPWHERLNQLSDPSFQVELLNKIILNVMSNFVPNKTIKIKPSEPEWFNREIKNMLKKQNRIYKKYKNNGFREVDKVPLDLHRKECADTIERSKQNYLLKLGDKLADDSTGQKTYWKIINKVLNKCKIPRIPPLLIADKFVICCKDKVALFNKYFVDQCQPFCNASVLPLFYLLTGAKLDSCEITVEQISNILVSLNINKAHGPDEISVNMIKLSGNALCAPLKLIFNNILETGTFPDQWKRANVTPVHKKDNKQFINNYRPISLLPIFTKVFEKIIFTNLYNHLVRNNLITINQSGFRPGDSVTNQLIYLVHEIFKGFDCPENLEVRSVYLDMSKAFDKVWHEGLIFKLKQNGVTGNLLKLLVSYLSNRKQRVVLNGMHSDWGSINSGVPQGSVLGPLLFLVYINDIEKGIKSSIKFFADDTSLFSVVRDPNMSAEELNHDLKLISQWAYQWKMSFNPDPTKPAEEIIFSRKRQRPDHPPLFFNDFEVKQVNDHKHLGLILDSQLTFANHINEKLKKARKGVGVIKYLSSFLPVKTLDQIYKMYVRPHLDFCDVIYHAPKIYNLFDSSFRLLNYMDQIERVQYQAALAVTGTWKGTSTNKIYEELGWESLTDRRWFRRLVQFYKIQNGFTPEYLKTPVPPPRSHLFGTRSDNDLYGIKCRTNLHMNSFYPHTVKIWNEIGPALRQAPSLSTFKSSILKLIRPQKKYIFNIHDPIGVKRLFQLRVGLSPLKHHKKRHNFKDTPTDTCRCQMSTETTEHYLIYCNLYIEERNDMFQVINSLLELNGLCLPNDDVLVKLLLYGHDSLNVADNTVVLAATLKYIETSSRFVFSDEYST